MAHSDVIQEAYHISHIAEWFHAFPHVDITFSSVNATFDPSNSAYLEALGIIIAVPGFYLILTLLAFLIFFLCRCCDSSFKRKRKITPLKWTLGFFALLCCGAIAVGLYGNEITHKGIDKIEDSAVNISDVVNSVKSQSIKIESLLNDDVDQDLKKLDGLFDVVANMTLRQFFESGIEQMKENVSIGLSKINDINHKVDSISFQTITGLVDEIEFIRWLATIGLLCLLIILCLTLIWGVIKHSRCLLILFSVFGLLSVVICWVLVSLYVGICVAGSDFCLNPEPFLYQQTNGVVDSGVLTYYIHCDDKAQDPFNKAVSEGQKALKNVNDTLKEIKEVTDEIKFPDKGHVIKETLTHLLDHIDQTGKLLETVVAVVKCQYINGEYKIAMESACTGTLEGVAFMLVSAVGSGLLFTVLIWVASHTWIHIRKKNGHSGNHEDHNYLHGRYTPPPAPDADLTCATKF